MEIKRLGLQDINFLPCVPGLYAASFPWPWLGLLMAALGVLAGWGERWLLRSVTPPRLVMAAGCAIAALDYERGLPGIFIDLRSAVVITAAMWLLSKVRARQRTLEPLQV